MHREGEYFAFYADRPRLGAPLSSGPTVTGEGQCRKGLFGAVYGCTRIADGASARGSDTRKVVPV
jgi:hypothetical protein